jgi:septation ring formation regulator EzrA
MNMPNDFFSKRLAAIEEENAAQAHADRLNQQIPVIVECIKKMRLTGLSDKEITALFRHAADELEKASDGA